MLPGKLGSSYKYKKSLVSTVLEEVVVIPNANTTYLHVCTLKNFKAASNGTLYETHNRWGSLRTRLADSPVLAVESWQQRKRLSFLTKVHSLYHKFLEVAFPDLRCLASRLLLL